MLINPAALLDSLQGFPGVDELQVVIGRVDANDPFSTDEMLVRLATRHADRNALADAVAARAQEAVRVRPRVEFADTSDIYDPGKQSKATRFLDTR